MGGADVDESDRLAKCVLFDRAFDKYEKRLSDQALFAFTGSGNPHWEESLVSRKLAPADDRVHCIGCSIAATQNGRPKPPVPRRYYLGFVEAAAVGLATTTATFRIALKYDDADTYAEHVAIQFFPLVEGRNNIAAARTEAGMHVASCFTGGVTGHMCADDIGDANHPMLLNPNCLERIPF